MSAIADLRPTPSSADPSSQPAGESFSPTTRARILPTVSQPIRISLVTCVWLICCASHAVR